MAEVIGKDDGRSGALLGDVERAARALAGNPGELRLAADALGLGLDQLGLGEQLGLHLGARGELALKAPVELEAGHQAGLMKMEAVIAKRSRAGSNSSSGTRAMFVTSA